jgi:hypothetical protein
VADQTDTFRYTISDGVSVASATVTVLITEGTPPANAGDDNAETTKGAAVDIDVLGNDSPATAVIDSVTDPPNGTTAIVSGKVRYTPTSGFIGSDAFSYTIREPGGTTDTATVSVQVTDPGTGPPPGPAEPTTATTITLTNNTYAALADAYAKAAPSTTIRLPDGTYSGADLKLDKTNPTSSTPIVIRAINVGKAIFACNAPMAGNYHVLSGIYFFDGKKVGVVSGRGNRITRCRFRHTNGYALDVATSAKDTHIDHNEFDGRDISASTDNTGGICMNGASGLNHWVHQNWFHDTVKSGHNSQGYAIGCGTGRGSTNSQTGIVVEYNLIENWVHEAEVLMTKSGGNTIRYNTLVNSFQLCVRHGNNNELLANYLENGNASIIDGGTGAKGSTSGKNSAIGNVIVGTGEFRIEAGNCSVEEWDAGIQGPLPGGSPHPQASNVLFRGNNCKVVIGAEYNDYAGRLHKAVNTRVEGHKGGGGSINNLTAGASGTVIDNTPVSVPVGTKLPRTTVGPTAP